MIVAHDSMTSWLSSLPEDAQLSVVLQTGLRDLGALLQADTHWRRFGESEMVWRELARRRWPRTWKPQCFTGWRAWVKSRLVKTAWVRGQLGWERQRTAAAPPSGAVARPPAARRVVRCRITGA